MIDKGEKSVEADMGERRKERGGNNFISRPAKTPVPATFQCCLRSAVSSIRHDRGIELWRNRIVVESRSYTWLTQSRNWILNDVNSSSKQLACSVTAIRTRGTRL